MRRCDDGCRIQCQTIVHGKNTREVNTHSTTRPPQQLFRELADLGGLVFAMLTGPQVAVGCWTAYSMAYVAVEGLCREVSRATGGLSRGFMTREGTADPRRIADANACLGRIGEHARTLIELLATMERDRLVIHGKPALQDVVAYHLATDGAWHRAFQERYCPGRVAPDGGILERSVLRIDPHPSLCACVDGSGPSVERHVFALEREQSRTRLGRTGRDVQVKLNQVYAAMGAFLQGNDFDIMASRPGMCRLDTRKEKHGNA